MNWFVTIEYLPKDTVHESSDIEWVAFLSKRSTWKNQLHVGREC